MYMCAILAPGSTITSSSSLVARQFLIKCLARDKLEMVSHVFVTRRKGLLPMDFFMDFQIVK